MLALFCHLLEVSDADFNYLNLRSVLVEIRKNEIRKWRSASTLGRSSRMVSRAFVDALHPSNGSCSVDEAQRKLWRTNESCFRTKGTKYSFFTASQEYFSDTSSCLQIKRKLENFYMLCISVNSYKYSIKNCFIVSTKSLRSTCRKNAENWVTQKLQKSHSGIESSFQILVNYSRARVKF